MNALWLLAAQPNYQNLKVSASVCPDLPSRCHRHIDSSPTSYEEF